MLANPGLRISSLFRLPPMVGVGRISYSLYLWHWPVYVIMRWTVGYDTALNAAIAVALTFGLAVASYRFIETPTRAWQRRIPIGFKPIGIGVATAMAVLAITATLVQYKPALTLSVTGDLPAWYPDAEWFEAPGGTCTVSETQESLSGIDVVAFAPRGCATPASAGLLFAAGDSHVDAYQRLLKRYALESGREVRSYALPGCGVVNFKGARADDRCSRLEDIVVADLAKRATPRDVIFLPSLRMVRWVDQWGAVGASTPQTPDMKAAIAQRMEVLTRRIAETGAEIVFEAPTPLFKLAPFRCSDWFNRSNPLCEPGFSVATSELEERRSMPIAGMEDLAGKLATVSIWDPFPILCPGESCDAMRDGRPLFFDQDHLSGYGNDVLLPSFSQAMSEAFSKTSRQASAEPSAR